MPNFSCFRKFGFLILALVYLSACSGDQQPSAGAPEPPMDSLVSVDWLIQHIDDPDLVVLDCSVLIEAGENGALLSVNGRDNFEAGHIPNAGFADLLGDLSDADAQYEFTAPSPEAFAQAMAKLGVGQGSRVVLYDNYNSAWAARVWWMLRWIGFDQAAILDGGFNAWKAADQPVSTGPAETVPAQLAVSLRPELMVDIDDVRAAIEEDTVAVIDVLPAESYNGEWAMYDRPGHIAGAVNVPGVLLLDETMKFRPLDEMDMLFDHVPEGPAITYCGGGIAASQNAFVMTRLGFKDVAVYDNSLQEWAADPTNPMETGPD